MPVMDSLGNVVGEIITEVYDTWPGEESGNTPATRAQLNNTMHQRWACLVTLIRVVKRGIPRVAPISSTISDFRMQTDGQQQNDGLVAKK